MSHFPGAFDPVLAAAVSESSDICVELARLTGGKRVLAFYVALLRLAVTMEGLYPDLRPLREDVMRVAAGMPAEVN